MRKLLLILMNLIIVIMSIGFVTEIATNGNVLLIIILGLLILDLMKSLIQDTKEN